MWATSESSDERLKAPTVEQNRRPGLVPRHRLVGNRNSAHQSLCGRQGVEGGALRLRVLIGATLRMAVIGHRRPGAGVPQARAHLGDGGDRRGEPEDRRAESASSEPGLGPGARTPRRWFRRRAWLRRVGPTICDSHNRHTPTAAAIRLSSGCSERNAACRAPLRSATAP